MKKRRKDPRDEYYDKKVDELEFNDNIDDAYTRSVMNKCLRGHQDNHWFAASGILSILIGAACVITMIVVGLVFYYSSESLHQLAVEGDYDYDAQKMKVIICSIVIPIIGLINIYIGLKIHKFSGYTREMLMRDTGVIVLFGILQFLVGGFFISFLTFIGYLVGRGMDYGAIYYNKVDTYSNKEWEQEERYLRREFDAMTGDIFDEKAAQKEEKEEKSSMKFRRKKRKKA